MDTYFAVFKNLKAFLDSSSKDALAKGYVIFQDKLQGIFIQRGYHEMKEKEKKIQKYFFSEQYRRLNLEARQEYKRKLYIQNPHFKEWYTDIGVLKSALGNRGCNYKIQGTAAKQSKLAQINMRNHFIENNLPVSILLLLHDESILETIPDYAEKASELQNKFMVEAANVFCPNVKFTTSGEISDKWEH